MSIKKLDDGRYKVSVYDAFGKRHQPMFERLTDARDYEDAIKKEKLDHKLIGAGARQVHYRLEDAIRDFMNSKENLRPSTKRRYQQVLTQFTHFINALNLEVVHEFTTDHASEFFNAIVAEKKDPKGSTDRILKPKPKTVNMYLMVVKALFKQEATKGHILSNPFRHVKNLKVEREHPDFYSEEELSAFFAVKISSPYKYFFSALLHSGMRYDEAASLRWSDVDFKKEVVHVRERDGFKPKTKNAIRQIPMNRIMMQLLLEIKKHPLSEELVFATATGKKIPERTALDKCKKAAKAAGITSVAKLHKFRATFASLLVQRGVMIQDVSKLLGHSSIKETEVYAYLAPDDMHDQVNKLDDLEIK